MHTYHAGLRPPQTRNLAMSGPIPAFKSVQIASLPVSARIPRRKGAACPSAKVMDKVEVETTSEPHSVRDGSNGAAAAQQYSKPRSREWEVTATLKATRKHQLQLQEREKPLGEALHKG